MLKVISYSFRNGRNSFGKIAAMTFSSKAAEHDPHKVEYWNKLWTEDSVFWHKSEVHPNLLNNIELVTGRKLIESNLTNPESFVKNSEKTWFLPLCGKTVDIPYLLSHGFRVFGVEVAKVGIEQLNSEHNLGMTYNEDTKVFTGMDGRVQVYVGDFFTCPLEKFGPFDYIWDRGSYIAIEYTDRDTYAATMQRALKNADGSWHNFSYLLETFTYDKSKFEGPPRSATDGDLKKHFGSWTDYRLLSTAGVAQGSVLDKALNGDASLRMFHLTPKL